MKKATPGKDGWYSRDHAYFELLRDTPVPRPMFWRQLKLDFSSWKPLAMVSFGVGLLVLGAKRHGDASLLVPGLCFLALYVTMFRMTMKTLRHAPVRRGIVRSLGKPHPVLGDTILTQAEVAGRADVSVVSGDAGLLSGLLAGGHGVEVMFLDHDGGPKSYAMVVAFRALADADAAQILS